ncbi:alcohol dehydrogenase [Burkholderia sp. WAC0059]|uniref:iron-containing alcohol dehydrogenase n=1 Tax=Burkholderia sp. WAC0059 TaxID=2066022 RepID=UPI000C7F3DA8|nr:iron-containing alcohol dehydrogenase [Burkholderia sp. WAC0059]PLZ00148.1 alcohol dehydrogenase [Burkholderia sp. WAC0059]
MSDFAFETTPKILCQQGGAARLHELVASRGAQRVFVVTDRGLLDAGVAGGVVNALEQAGLDVAVFPDVLADPPEHKVLEAVEAARAARAEFVIGLGGGSSMDTAKLVALLARTPQPLDAIYGIGLAKGPRLPLVQVPTTAGTGSEVTPISIVTTPGLEKKGVVSPLLYPDAAVLDSTLTLGLPPAVTAMTGVDAMVHAIEAYTSRLKKNPLSDTFAVKALQLLYRNIGSAVADGKDPAVRERMLLGSLMAGIAFANAPVGAVHALAYPLGGHYHLPHGLTNSLMLGPTLRFNLRDAAPLYAELGRAILPETAGLAPDAAAQAFVEAICATVRTMPYAQTLREAGVAQDDLPMLARDAMNVQRLLVNNPREVALDDALALYREAY